MQVFHCKDTSASDGSTVSADALNTICAHIRAGKVICLPTDTVYGIGADPFNPDAVTALLEAKSRTRQMPPPVLVADLTQAQALIDPCARAGVIAQIAKQLIHRFWPGALTIILPVNPQIGWDLGETHSTVALRMPDHAVARRILGATGPLAVTSANKTGQPPAHNVSQAQEQLAEAVSIYIDAGEAPGGVPSTILRLHTDHPREVDVVRCGAIDPGFIEQEIGGIKLTPVK